MMLEGTEPCLLFSGYERNNSKYVLIYKGLAPVWKNSGSHDLIMTYYADSDGEGEFGKSTHQILNIGSHGSKNVGFKDDLFSHKTMYSI